MIRQLRELISVFLDILSENEERLKYWWERPDEFKEKLAKLLLGEALGSPVATSSILKLVGTITIPATTTQFITKDKFIVDTNPEAKVKILYFWGDFKKYFLDTVEEPIPETTLRAHKLLKPSLDPLIIAELGGKAKAAVTLQEIFSLLGRQGHGQAGTLLTNGFANIFYVLDEHDKDEPLRAVSVYWNDDGWNVSAFSVRGPGVWDDGNQVFSRNS